MIIFPFPPSVSLLFFFISIFLPGTWFYDLIEFMPIVCFAIMDFILTVRNGPGNIAVLSVLNMTLGGNIFLGADHVTDDNSRHSLSL